MEYKHKTFGSLAVRTRYAYQITFIQEVDNFHTIDDAETIVFTSARMAFKVMSEIDNDPNITLLEYKEIVMHV